MLGCTSLGPMPATTGQSFVPAPRPGAELQAGLAPGYYLSEATRQGPRGTAIGQVAGMIEPGDAIGLPGLALGGRVVDGGDGAAYGEPMLRYRAALDPRISLGAVAFGTYAKGEATGAAYSMTRGGVELGYDLRITPESVWAELHAFSSFTLTGLDATGRYCTDADGYGIDCADGTAGTVSGSASGVFPSLTGGAALDFGRHLGGIFHGGRVALMAGGGAMPRVVDGKQKDERAGYFTGGLLLTLMGGAGE